MKTIKNIYGNILDSIDDVVLGDGDVEDLFFDILRTMGWMAATLFFGAICLAFWTFSLDGLVAYEQTGDVMDLLGWFILIFIAFGGFLLTLAGVCDSNDIGETNLGILLNIILVGACFVLVFVIGGFIMADIYLTNNVSCFCYSFSFVLGVIDAIITIGFYAYNIWSNI